MSLTELMKERLKDALNAKRIAVVGATQEQHPVGMGPILNLLSSSFEGEVIPVNPKYDVIMGKKCFQDIESISPPADLAILLLNHHSALEMAERAGRHGVKAVTIVSGGFKEVDSEGQRMEQRLREIATLYEMPVIGPNTLGFSSFHTGLHGIFWHLKASRGSIAVISQSGGVGLSIAYSLRNLDCGLSHFIGAGNCSVVGFADYLEALQENPLVRAFSLFIEGLENPKEFYQVAKTITPQKPMVVYKAGRNKEVSKATATHTGSLTGEYRLYKAMFMQAGIVEADSVWDSAVISKSLSMLDPPKGNRLCALTFTAGPSIVAMDRLLIGGWQLPDISAPVRNKIGAIIGEKTPVRIQNPVDLTGPGFLPHVYTRVLKNLLAEPFDAYFLVWSYNPLIRVPVTELEGFCKTTQKPMVLILLASQAEARACLEDLHSRGICAYSTPEDGATALNALLARHRFLKRRAQEPNAGNGKG